MGTMAGRTGIWLAAGAVLVSAAARSERLPVQRHGVAEGLAEETVTALLKDSRGFLWIGSLNGLSRYDGEHFSVYTAEDGLPKARVTALAETPDGTLWVATSGGLVRLEEGGPSGRLGGAPAGGPLFLGGGGPPGGPPFPPPGAAPPRKKRVVFLPAPFGGG